MNTNIKKATLIAFGIFIVGLIISFFVPTNENFRPWLFWLYAGIAYTAFSFRWWNPVKQDERAARIFFGQDAGDVDSGVTFAPLGLIQVHPVKVTVTQREFPGEPTKVYRGNLEDPDIDQKLEGQVLPIRVPFLSSISKDEAEVLFGEQFEVTSKDRRTKVSFNANVPNDGLASRITAELFMVVRFSPKAIYQFVRNIGDIDEATKQIEDEMVSTATQYLGRMSYAQAIANLRWLNIILYRAVEKRTGTNDEDNGRRDHAWGIELHDVRIKAIELDHETNRAIRDAAKAHFNATATVTAAGAEKEAITLRGAAEAQAARDLEAQTLIGRAEGQKRLAESLGVTGSEVQAAEVAREIAKGGNATIFGADGLAQAASVVGAMIKKKDAPDKKGGD